MPTSKRKPAKPAVKPSKTAKSNKQSTRKGLATLARSGTARQLARAGTTGRKTRGRSRDEARDATSTEFPDAVYLDR